MGEPVGKASGRTLNRISTCLPDPCWSSLLMKSSIPLRNVDLTAVRSLGKRFTHVRLCNDEVNSLPLQELFDRASTFSGQSLPR